MKSLSCVRLLATPWTAAYQAPLSMGFSRQEDWSGLPFPSPGILPPPGIEPASLTSPALANRFFTTEPPGKPFFLVFPPWGNKLENENHILGVTESKVQISDGIVEMMVCLPTHFLVWESTKPLFVKWVCSFKQPNLSLIYNLNIAWQVLGIAFYITRVEDPPAPYTELSPFESL